MRPARLLAVALLGSLFFRAAMAPAQGKDPPVAEALFREGREAMKKKDYASACPKFEESQRLDPSPGTLLNLAECEEPLGKLTSAWQHLQEALEVMPPDDKRVARAKEKKAALDKRVPRLTIKLAAGAPSGTRVKRDEVELGAASLGTALPVNVGDHVLTVVAPGRKETKVNVSIGEGAKKEVEVSPGEEEAGPGPTSGGTSGAASRAPGSPGSPTVGYVIGGVGVASLAVGGVIALFVLPAKVKKVQDFGCTNGACTNQQVADQAESAAKDGRPIVYATYVFLGVGAVATGLGAYLVLSRGSDGKAAAMIHATPVPGGGAFEMRGRF